MLLLVVLRDVDRVWCQCFVKRARFGTQNPKRIGEAHSVQIQRNSARRVIRIEQNIQSGKLPDRGVDVLGVFHHVQGNRLVGDWLQFNRPCNTGKIALERSIRRTR